MKKTAFYILTGLLLITASCKRPEAPVFEKVREIKVIEESNDLLLLTAYADFYNPNNYRIILKRADIDVFLNEKMITTLEKEYNLEIDKKSSFSIPLQVALSREEISNNILSHALNILLGRKLTVNYTGHIRVKAWGMGIKVPVDGETSLDIREF